ncbi:PREDICTED: ABC transporter C family member 10-like isoform X3 [Nicotiana attenuata]|uniref:ABC transporter C family member 10-like isoform X3 n=1 Tax=Nicotiana attenuata TaxID=49451 RepID=UPI0009052818|nr:PREDICTED: ABC transporter C family member 10-like isoform X3 [Nicotiana attenuata]
MEDLWTVFCGCSDDNVKLCRADFGSMTDPSSCINHISIICFDVILVLIFLFTLFYKASLRATKIPARFHGFSRLQLISAIFNGFLGLIYLSFGIWILEDQEMTLPLHWWLPILFHGMTWLLVSCTTSLGGEHFSKTPLRLLSVLSFIFAGISSGLSFFADKRASVKIGLDVLSSLGACLLLLCTYKGLKQEDVIRNDLYAPLNNAVNKSNSVSSVTPFAKAGIFSKMSFWWLNPLMKKGKEKTLEDEDIPGLREADRAESCYLLFEELLNKQKQVDPSSQPSVLKTIVLCHRKEIIVSGFFALLKITTLSAGPLLLNAFIKVAEGNASFKNEGLFLAILLFTSKSLESLSQRQWYFRSRLIGLKVRSLLTAAIYRKQIRLSNSAKLIHSSGEIMNYVTVDAYRIGEFPFWMHQTWTTSVQLFFALIILFSTVGLATVASLVVIILTVLCNTPLAKLQHKFQSKLMVAQDDRLKAISEALVSMKVLRLYAWEAHFKNVIQNLRQVEEKWLSAVQLRRSYNSFLFWSSPVLVSAATFGTCYFLGIQLNASNVFTFVATLRLVQDPVRTIPDVIGMVIQAKVAFERIIRFLEASELEMENLKQKHIRSSDHSVLIKSANLSWEENPTRPTLRNINLEVKQGEKVAICGEVGSGKSTLLATILGEVPSIQGTVQVYGTTAYVSQSAWIQTGTIRENILFGSPLDSLRYQQTLDKCSLLKDLELLPYGDLTEIGERGVNLSGGQKQRIQLARALYHDADIYLLDDPFSAVDAHTATSLFNDYIMEALSGKTVLLVTHQVDFLPAFDVVLLMSDGEILHTASYHQLLALSKEFQDLVNAHKETAGSERVAEVFSSPRSETCTREIHNKDTAKQPENSGGDQLIKQEEREVGDSGFKPYVQYLNQNKGYLFFAMAVLSQLAFVAGQILQNSWMAANVENPEVSTLRLISVYLLIGVASTLFLLSRSLLTVVLGLQSSKSLFSRLLNSLFRAPMSFYDSTPLGRILSRVSSDLSIVDLDIPFNLIFAVAATTNFYSNLGVLAVVTWQVLFVSIPMVYVAVRLQAPPVFDGENYQLWAVRMETYLEALNVLPLPNNPTVAQIKSHKEKKTRKSKAKATLFAGVSATIFTRVMALKSAKEIWDYLKGEYTRDERIRGMKVLNLIREFELQKMKESETVKEYSDLLLGIFNKAQEQRRLMRQDGMVEGALAANHKTQSKGNNVKKNYPPCQHCGKKGHPPFKCWKRPDAKCKICNQLGHEAVICKGKYQKHEADAQVANEEEEDHLFVATILSTKKSDFWFIDSGCTNHMTYDRNLFKEFTSIGNKKVRIGNGDYILAKGKGPVAIPTNSEILLCIIQRVDADQRNYQIICGQPSCRIHCWSCDYKGI